MNSKTSPCVPAIEPSWREPTQAEYWRIDDELKAQLIRARSALEPDVLELWGRPVSQQQLRRLK